MNNSANGDFSRLRVFGALAFGLSAIGFSPILVKAVNHESAFLVAAVRTSLAFLFLVPVYLFSGKRKTERVVSKREHLWVVISGTLLGLHLITWVASIYYTSIASASILVTTHPIILIVFERFVYKYRFKATVWIGVLVAFLGSVVLGYSDSEVISRHTNPILGNSLAILAAAIFAVYFLIGNRVRQKREWLEYVFPVYGYAAITAVLALFIVHGFSFELNGLLLLVGAGLALGPQIAGHGSLNYAVKYVSPTLLATLILLEPAISTLMAFLIYDEVPPFMSFMGMGIILAGIVLTWARRTKSS
tara:strand:- start:25370 stop:26281 length:912 start_codon:yes stop_codon:yes gene_type:complete